MYGCQGRREGVAEEIFTSGVLVFLCVFCVSWSKLRCQTVWSLLLHIKHFVRSTSWETRYGHIEKRARLLCSLLLVFFSIVQLFARSQWNSILCQGTLTRLDPWIELQTIEEKKDLKHNYLEMFMFKQWWSHLLYFFITLNKSYEIEIKNVISVSLVWPKPNLHNTVNQTTQLCYCINFKTLKLDFYPQ